MKSSIRSSLKRRPENLERNAFVTQRFPKTQLKLSMSADGKILGDWNAESVQSFLASDTVEELLLTLVPVILGGKKMSLSGLPGNFLPQDLAFNLKKINKVQGESGAMQLHYVRNRRKKS